MKRFFLLQIMLLITSSSLYAKEKITLKLNHRRYPNTQNQVPIDVSIEESTITLLFWENAIYQVVIKGEEGVVYQR